MDARVVSAMNRDLDAAVKTGTFREDFFYRLNVFSIVAPPLRDRREDVIPDLGTVPGIARGARGEALGRGARAPPRAQLARQRTRTREPA